VEAQPWSLECGFVLLGFDDMTFGPFMVCQDFLSRRKRPGFGVSLGIIYWQTHRLNSDTLFSEVRVNPTS
jgi:hypothetical protein